MNHIENHSQSQTGHMIMHSISEEQYLGKEALATKFKLQNFA